MATIVLSVAEMQRFAEKARSAGKRVSVVPTMGFLHEGHLSLIRAARERADVVITTIFVNPTQFGPAEDFDRYPRDLTRDASLADSAGTDYIFAPGARDIYPEGYSTYVDVERLGDRLEGASRPGHFRGVATVVTKLFNITKPHVALFGQKDAQQVVIVRRLIRDLNIDVELLVMPTVREADGVAMSSRNAYLTASQRREAPVLYQALRQAEELIRTGKRSSALITQAMRDIITTRSSGVIDYISVADGETLEELVECTTQRPLLISLAVRFGSTRLIDNSAITL